MFAQTMPDFFAPFPKRVLVVDDNEASALTLTWAMELYGFDVKTCFDGKTAIQVAHDFEPAVVLLDIGMPVMDGYEVCRHLRKDPLLKHTRVFAQTGWADVETRARAADAGFDHHNDQTHRSGSFGHQAWYQSVVGLN